MFLKKIFGALLVLALFALPQKVSAIDRIDSSFDFRNLRAVIVLDMTVDSRFNVGGNSGLLSLQNLLDKNSRRLGCTVYTQQQALQMLGMSGLDPVQARRFIMQNAYQIADAWIEADITAWETKSYVEAERTVWESRNRAEIYGYNETMKKDEQRQVPVTYPPQRVDVSTVQVTFEVFDARRGMKIFEREDSLTRKTFQSHLNLFDEMSDSFFVEVARMIH